MDYLIFIFYAIGAMALCSAASFYFYKRGLAFRMNVIVCVLCAIFSIAGYILGKSDLIF